MPQLILDIKAKDFDETHYYDSHDCAITRALKLAGHSELYDAGTQICFVANGRTLIDRDTNIDYAALTLIVIKMYWKEIEVEDFQHIINY